MQANPSIKYTEYDHPLDKWIFVSLISCLLAFNLLLLVFKQEWTAVVPIIFETVVILMALRQHPLLPSAIVYWAFLIFILPGALKSVDALFFNNSLDSSGLLDKILGIEQNHLVYGLRAKVGIGLTYFATKSLEIVNRDSTSKASDDQSL